MAGVETWRRSAMEPLSVTYTEIFEKNDKDQEQLEWKRYMKEQAILYGGKAAQQRDADEATRHVERYVFSSKCLTSFTKTFVSISFNII